MSSCVTTPEALAAWPHAVRVRVSLRLLLCLCACNTHRSIIKYAIKWLQLQISWTKSFEGTICNFSFPLILIYLSISETFNSYIFRYLVFFFFCAISFLVYFCLHIFLSVNSGSWQNPKMSSVFCFFPSTDLTFGGICTDNSIILKSFRYKHKGPQFICSFSDCNQPFKEKTKKKSKLSQHHRSLSLLKHQFIYVYVTVRQLQTFNSLDESVVSASKE